MDTADRPVATAQAAPLLQVRELSAAYGTHTILRDVSLEIPPAQWFALLGPNGVGKTTLLHCIVGLLAPSRGEVRICEHPMRTEPRLAKAHLGFSGAPERLPGLLTGRQCLQIHAAARDLAGIDPQTLELAAAFDFSPMLDRFVDTYSTGTRQKLSVLLALLGEPRLIVLDEAFNGLDPASALVLKRHLRSRVEQGRASVLLATHGLGVVERYADRAALLLAGRLVHEWQADEIAALRGSREGLEGAMAAVAAGFLRESGS